MQKQASLTGSKMGCTNLVSTGEADGRRRGLGSSASDDVDLRALHVELGATGAAGAVQGQHLGTEKVLTMKQNMESASLGIGGKTKRLAKLTQAQCTAGS